MKTYSPKASDVQRRWWVLDADGRVLGRLASEVARLLRGKHKPMFAPHIDTGDHVIVVNAAKVRLTGRKLQQKFHRRHSGYPGALKEFSYERMMQANPERVIELAVKGMLPKNRLGRQMYKKLHVYAGSEHGHEAQRPEPWSPPEVQR